MTITRDQVLAALTRHIGRDKGVRVQELVYEITGVTLRSEGAERKVRAVVSELREEGFAICAYPGDGYYMAGSADELEACCAFLRSRAMHSLVLESRLRKIALAELIGQLRLNT